MSSYLKHRTFLPAQIIKNPVDTLGLVVVIPCYDEPDILSTLSSLWDCDLPECGVEVIVVFNDSERDEEAVKSRNRALRDSVRQWGKRHLKKGIRLFDLYCSDLPAKFAGVGLARKIGMDEAAFRLKYIDKENGIIACLDADSRCDKNYFLGITRFFEKYPRAHACSVYFEHPVDGENFPPEVYDAVVLYELHLRYYINAQRYIGFPFAYQTVGSSMAVRCIAYIRQSGMNRRQAGEDFYFLQKFIPLGYFGEVNATRVVPSPRISERVPFGTGRAVGKIVESGLDYKTYNPQIFKNLNAFFEDIPLLFDTYGSKLVQIYEGWPEDVSAFLEYMGFWEKLGEIRQNTATQKTFVNRFFKWFNAFTLMKFVHFSRDKYYENVPVEEAVSWLLKEYVGVDVLPETHLEMLEILRKWDRERQAGYGTFWL